MILKVLMEENQLDFNQPLLSVRRFSSTVTSENDNKRKTGKSVRRRPPLPTYKSELKSGPLSNPGTVPFVWEKTPGRPKNESKLQTQAIERPFMTPKLPPGRVLKVEQQYFERVPKGTSVTQPRTESATSDSHSVSSLDNKVRKNESRKEVIHEKESSGSDDGDEAYLDALDTLSRTESFFMNCSVSGLSGWDDQEVQSSESFSTDQQARDFMIGRFLPAAKAMASETPHSQYNSRKPIVKQEQQPRVVRKVVTGANSHPLDPKWQKILPHYTQDIDREESEDGSDDDDRSEHYAGKVCGLFPRFCLLNPIPGLRMDDRMLSSADDRVPGKSFASHRRTTQEHARTANYGKRSEESQSGSTKEKDFRGITESSKHSIDPHRRGFSTSFAHEGPRYESSSESPVVEKTLYVDSMQKVKSSSSEMKGPNNEEGGGDFETLRKYGSIDKNPCIDSSIEDSKHLSIVDEKAALQPKSSGSLYPSLLVCSDNSMQMKMTNRSDKQDSEKQGLIKPGYQRSKLDQDLAVVSSPEMAKCNKIESENKSSSCEKISEALVQNPVSWRNLKSGNDSEFDKKCTHDSNENPNALARSKLVADRKIELESQPPMKFGNGETSYYCSMKLPLALPSPRAPSESWLKRTLPTVSSRNISSRSNLAIHAPTQAHKTASQDPKWEIIVKSSNVHRGHLRFAEELTPIPEA